jgi:hypothetical protein
VEGNDPLVARVEALQNFPKPVIAGNPEVIRQVELRPKRLAPLESLKLTPAIPFLVVRW